MLMLPLLLLPLPYCSCCQQLFGCGVANAAAIPTVVTKLIDCCYIPPSFATVIVTSHSVSAMVCWCILYCSFFHGHHCSWLFLLEIMRCSLMGALSTLFSKYHQRLKWKMKNKKWWCIHWAWNLLRHHQQPIQNLMTLQESQPCPIHVAAALINASPIGQKDTHWGIATTPSLLPSLGPLKTGNHWGIIGNPSITSWPCMYLSHIRSCHHHPSWHCNHRPERNTLGHCHCPFWIPGPQLFDKLETINAFFPLCQHLSHLSNQNRPLDVVASHLPQLLSLLVWL